MTRHAHSGGSASGTGPALSAARSRRLSRFVAALAVLVAGAVSACSDDQSERGTAAERSDSRAAAARETVETPASPEPARARRLAAVVALERAGAAAVLRGPRWRVARRLPLPAGPHNVAVSPDGRFAAVTSPPADRVTLIDVRRARVLARATVGGAPHDVSFTRDGGAVWVSAESAGRVVKLSVPRGRVLGGRRTAAPPHDLRVTPDGRHLWVTLDGSGVVEVRGARRGRLLARATPGGAPHDLAFEPEGRRIWFSNWSSGTLTVASRGTGRRVASVAAGAEPHHFAFGLGCLWVSDNDRGVLVRVAPDRLQVRGTTVVGAAPHHVAVVGRRVLVAVNGSGRVAIADRRGRVARTLRVGSGPHGIAGTPTRSTLAGRERCR
jgi:DNA-binding beta-propeller fold protein YncE